MAAVRIRPAAARRLDEIYRYTRDRWGTDQASRYIRGLFATFERIDEYPAMSRPIPAVFGVDGFVCRHEHHLIYWRRLSDGAVAIMTVLHVRMHQMGRFRDDFRP